VPVLRTRAPYTVLAYLAVVAVILVVALADDGPDGRLLRGGLVLVFASVGLYHGFWLAWLFLALVAAGDMLHIALDLQPWWIIGILTNGTMLALLVSRPTRKHARRGRPRLAR
jgi:flagellar biosynthesis protein FliR